MGEQHADDKVDDGLGATLIPAINKLQDIFFQVGARPANAPRLQRC